MNKEREQTPTTTAELETKLALIEKELTEQRLENENIKKDNETLLKLNKQLQLAVGVVKRDEGDDKPDADEPPKKTPRDLQDELVAKISIRS